MCTNCNKNKNNCTTNGQLWHLIYNLQKANGGKKIVLTSEQRFALCNYMNGKLYNRKVLQPFIK
jgi:hypothetical protein